MKQPSSLKIRGRPRNETMPKERGEVKPFNCTDTMLYRLAGDVIASGAAAYVHAGKNIKCLARMHTLGRISNNYYRKETNLLEGIIHYERAFILSGRFRILLGWSRMDGRDVIKKIENQIDAYDPTYDVPGNNPTTGLPYDIRKWRRMLKEKEASR